MGSSLQKKPHLRTQLVSSLSTKAEGYFFATACPVIAVNHITIQILARKKIKVNSNDIILLHSLRVSRKVLTIIIFPPLPTVIPEFLNPESIATECCRTNKCLKQVLHTFTARNNYGWVAMQFIISILKKTYWKPSPQINAVIVTLKCF